MSHHGQHWGGARPSLPEACQYPSGTRPAGGYRGTGPVGIGGLGRSARLRRPLRNGLRAISQLIDCWSSLPQAKQRCDGPGRLASRATCDAQ